MQVQVINHCAISPPGLEWQVRRSLRWINRQDLSELSLIYLEDKMPLLTERASEWAKKAEAESLPVYGWYAPSRDGRAPYIVLYIHEIYRAVPSWLWWSTVPTLRVTRSLAHEVAHHCIATKGYVFQATDDIDDEESLANRYADSILQKMTEQFAYRVGQWLLKEIASWHYAFGSADWRRRKYINAARHFFEAWDLDPTNQGACYWYWRAKQMSDTKSS